jgi:hypothetical protein
VFAIYLMMQALVSFVTVAQGPMSGIEEPRHVVIRTAGEWQTVWKAHDPVATAPAVDFTRAVVIGVFLGSRPTSGFTVEITAVKTQDALAVVEYIERRPAPGAIVAQVLTSPFHLVRLPREVDSIQFKKVER